MCVCARPHSDKSSCCVWVGVDYNRNMASVFSGSVLLSLDVCGRAPETSLPSSVRLMPLASLCVHVKIGSQVSSIPADYSGSRGNDNSQNIGNRVKSHYASGSKLTIVQFVWVKFVELNGVEMWLCCAVIRLTCTGKRTKELSSFLVAVFTLGERTTGCFGRFWSFSTWHFHWLATCFHAGPETWLSFNTADVSWWVADAF